MSDDRCQACEGREVDGRMLHMSRCPVAAEARVDARRRKRSERRYEIVDSWHAVEAWVAVVLVLTASAIALVLVYAGAIG